jgi:hypothetical protein
VPPPDDPPDDRDSGDVAVGRSTTKPLRLGSLEVDFTDGESVAEFLELMARLIRERKRLRIVLE